MNVRTFSGSCKLKFQLWTGSEGRLAFPYQRIGMINALQELSNAPEGKHLKSLSLTICKYLLSCYKDEGCLLCFDLLIILFLLEYFTCICYWASRISSLDLSELLSSIGFPSFLYLFAFGAYCLQCSYFQEMRR